MTLGLTYEKNPRFAGGAYSSFLKKVDRFVNRPLAASLRERSAFAARLQQIDTEVKRIVGALQARGFKSPYLRNYVVARINPVRFHKAKKGDSKPANAHRAGADTHGRSGQKVQRPVGVECGSGMGCRGSRRAGLARRGALLPRDRGPAAHELM